MPKQRDWCLDHFVILTRHNPFKKALQLSSAFNLKLTGTSDMWQIFWNFYINMRLSNRSFLIINCQSVVRLAENSKQ
jgi:hypothetical protein